MKIIRNNFIKQIDKGKQFLKTKRKESFLLSFLSLFFVLFFAIAQLQKTDKAGDFSSKNSESTLSSDSTLKQNEHDQDKERENTFFTERKRDQFLSPRPSIMRYNMIDKSPDSNPLNSVGAAIYKELMERENADLARIYDSAGDTPENTAKMLGIKRSRILGKYNPQAQGQSPNQQNSWTIPYFKNIHYRYYDGDGKEIQESSNIKDILAMASVYTYQHNYLDEERFRAIVEELYQKSHSYSLSIGPVYYDQGCIYNDAKAEMLAEEATMTDKSSDEIIREDVGKETVFAKEDSQNKNTKEKIDNIDNIDSNKERIISETLEVKQRDSSETVVSDQEDLNIRFIQSPSELPKETNSKSKTNSIQEQKNLPKNYCPGHVDLTIKITVVGFDDENGLRNIQLDSIKDLEEQDQKPGSRWHGWDDYTIAAVKRLKEQDWFKDYGLSISSVEKKSPLTEEEISAYMKDLPEDLSEERKALIHFALSSVGKVPYFYGGKAGVKGLEGNHFGATISSSDYKGRNRKGLDCSGFVQWAYWSSVDRSLDFASSTQELIGKGQKIKRSELKAGDLIIQPSGESHVVVFIKWTKEGKMLAIHENGTAGNVSVDEVQANYPYYRSILP